MSIRRCNTLTMLLALVVAAVVVVELLERVLVEMDYQEHENLVVVE